MGEDVSAALVVVAILAFFGFIIWNRTRLKLERQRLQLDAQAQILEKIGPGQVLTDFLGTAEGKHFLDQLTWPESAPASAKDMRSRILILTTLGLIALFAGFFFIMAVVIPNLLSDTPGASIGEALLTFIPLFFLTGAGAGALIAAWLMHRLLKKWGMLEDGRPDEAVGR